MREETYVEWFNTIEIDVWCALKERGLAPRYQLQHM